MFHDNELSKTKDNYYLEPGLYHSITGIVEAMNSLIQNRNNQNTTCIDLKMDRRTHKVAFSFDKDESSSVISSVDLGHVFRGDVFNDRGILMLGRGPYKPLFAYDSVRILSRMIYTDIVEYNIVGDTKSTLITMLSFHIKDKVR